MALGLRCATSLLVAGLCASCSMFHDDLPECAVRPKAYTHIHFSYEYNALGEDEFLTSVGAVTLYIADSDGNMLQQIEHIVTPEEIEAGGTDLTLELPVGEYTLYAAGHASSATYEEYLLNPGARFRRTTFTPGSPASEFLLALDHVNGTVDHAGQQLEDTWVTLREVPLSITEPPMPAEGDPQPADIYIDALVELQRVTNHLHITIIKGDTATRAGIDPSDYEIWVESTHGIHEIDLEGQPSSNATNLTYTPHSIAPTTVGSHDALLADISTSRLLHDDANTSQNPRLYIRSHNSGETFSWDLTSLLAKGNDAYASQGWSNQEYLDRQGNYELSVQFNEQEDDWRYIEVSISILSWAKRIQNVAL